MQQWIEEDPRLVAPGCCDLPRLSPLRAGGAI